MLEYISVIMPEANIYHETVFLPETVEIAQQSGTKSNLLAKILAIKFGVFFVIYKMF